MTPGRSAGPVDRRARAAPCRASSTSSRRRTGTSARRTTCTACEFDGHEPMRALVTHTDDPEQWMTPVSGDGVHQVAVGPIHAGVIESGHFRFHVVGERILVMDPRLFYKHRGLERAAEGHAYAEAHAHVQRACAACAVVEHARLRAGGRGDPRPRARPRAAGRADGAARARARLQPPPRHLRDLRRRRLRAGRDGVRGAQGPRPADQCARVRPPLPVRHDRRRGGRGRA